MDQLLYRQTRTHNPARSTRARDHGGGRQTGFLPHREVSLHGVKVGFDLTQREEVFFYFIFRFLITAWLVRLMELKKRFFFLEM